MAIETELEFVMGAPTLQNAKLRFQYSLLNSSDPMKLRHILWPFLYGLEGAAHRDLVYGSESTGFG